MLTSFGCEQIVQVRATEVDSKSASAWRAPVEIYSGTWQSSATAKRAQYRRGNAPGSRDALLLVYWSFVYTALGLLQDRGCPESASVNANLVLLRQEAVLTIFRSR